MWNLVGPLFDRCFVGKFDGVHGVVSDSDGIFVASENVSEFVDKVAEFASLFVR